MPPRRAELRELIQRRSIDDAAVAHVKEILAEAGSFDYARLKAREHIDRAVQALDRLPTLATRPALKTLADFVINRNF